MELKFKGYYIEKPNKKKLNKKQKQWLVDNGYVDSVVLDSYNHHKGWERYFIENFDWVLLGKQQYGLEVLQLIDNGKNFKEFKGEVSYEVHLILNENKYKEMTGI